MRLFRTGAPNPVFEFEVASLVESQQISGDRIEPGVQGIGRTLLLILTGYREQRQLGDYSRAIQTRKVLQPVSGVKFHHKSPGGDDSLTQLRVGRDQRELGGTHGSGVFQGVGSRKK